MLKPLFLFLTLFVAFNASNIEQAFAKKIDPPSFVAKEDIKSQTDNIGKNLSVGLYALSGIVFAFTLITGGILISDDQSDAGWKRIKNGVMGTGVVLFSGFIVHAFA